MKRLINVFALLTLAASLSVASAAGGILVNDRGSQPPQTNVAGLLVSD